MLREGGAGEASGGRAAGGTQAPQGAQPQPLRRRPRGLREGAAVGGHGGDLRQHEPQSRYGRVVFLLPP
eukprot:7585888-Pyramimonas_sp.AAC.1